jgi:predicted ester cyclase
MSSTMGPGAVVRAINAARAGGDFEAAALLIGADSLDQGQHVTREVWKQRWAMMRSGIPDLEILTQQSIENGDWVANRYLLRGTQTGEFFGQPATGQRIEMLGMDMVRVEAGQVVEHWVISQPLVASV